MYIHIFLKNIFIKISNIFSIIIESRSKIIESRYSITESRSKSTWGRSKSSESHLCRSYLVLRPKGLETKPDQKVLRADIDQDRKKTNSHRVIRRR